MKDYYGEFQYKDRVYKTVFNLNVMEAIQKEYGSVNRWGELTEGEDGEADAQAFIFGFREMLNEGIDIDNEEEGTHIPFFTHKQVGRMLTEIGLRKVATMVHETVLNSSKSEEKNA